jgi:hypothetical protein
MRNIGCILGVLLVLTIPAFAATPTKTAAAAPAALPKLVLQITIDQLRGDMPLRYQERFGKGGFRYFLDHGTWYADANYSHSHTETIVGHGTLATGAYPSRHGLVGDKAFSEQTADNPEQSICSPQTAPPASPASTDINEAVPVPGGATPETLLTTTFSDELTLTTAGQAKVFAVSWKDRASVPMAGHSGKAFWFTGASGCFASSSYYYPAAYPEWVTTWCGRHPADQYKNAVWNLMYDPSTYLYRDQKNQYPAGTPPERNMQMLDSLLFGRTFPHKVAEGSSYYDALSITPFNDELTLSFAQELMLQEKLGKDAVPDYLSISFSATDLGGHWFGPSSLEAEDGILRLDRTLEKLLQFVDKEVGLKNTLIVLAGDHGTGDYPEYLQTLHIATGRVSMQTIRDAAISAVKDKYGIDGIIAEYSHPWIYLCHNVIDDNNLDLIEVQRVVARAVLKVSGVALAIANADPHSPGLDNDAQTVTMIRNSYHPRRSGDVYVVQKPQWQVDDAQTRGPVFLSHGSPWTYDTYVPVAFAGANVGTAMVYRGISIVDVAPTLAARMRTKFPSGNIGVPLKEVMGEK